MIEDKFVHGCGRVGHIEDVVVQSGYRGTSLGIRVIEALHGVAKRRGCYKVILDCAESNMPFYNKLNYKEHQRHMANYDDFKHVSTDTNTAAAAVAPSTMTTISGSTNTIVGAPAAATATTTTLSSSTQPVSTSPRARL
jgi:3-polyprenyl-4-hydroxybenzoate decarboxylase